MKKFFALVLAAMMICAVMTTAMASASINWSGSETSGWYDWTSTPVKSTGEKWSVSWGSKTNISSDMNAVVRVYSGSDAASSTWTCRSKTNGTYRAYYPGFGSGAREVKLCGHMDGRSSGTLVVDGTFYN